MTIATEIGQVPRRRARLPMAVTAAGQKIDVSLPSETKDLLKRPLPWQKQAYTFYDPSSANRLGEAWFAARYVAESLSRLRLFPAIILDPEDEPISLFSDQIPEAYRPPPAEVDAAVAAVRRLTNSHGGQADIMRGFGLNNFLAGESFLIGRTIDDMEEWEVHSVMALARDPQHTDALALKLHPNAQGDQLIPLDNATVVRVWRRHAMYPDLPDAAMGAAIPYCEDLVLYRHMIRAAGRSRMPSGILGIPDEASDDIEDAGNDEEGTERKDPLTEALLKHFMTPISDPSDAAAVVPFILRLASADLDKVQKWDFSREIDKLAIELRKESREAFAATIDLPADVLTGKQGLNDWSAWNVDEETFRVHLAPHAELIATGLTAGYLWPTLLGAVEDPRRYCLWYDATALISHPNRAKNAVEAHKSIVISDETFRESLGFDETDAPDDAEVERRIEILQAQRGRLFLPGEPGSVTVPTEANAPSAAGPTEGAQGHAVAASAVVAAVGRANLGYQLASIERTLMGRLLTAIDAEMRRMLERAGARIASAARSWTAGEQVHAIVASSPTMALAANLGPALVAALGLTDDALLAGGFEGLRGRWDSWVNQAQRQGQRAIVEEGQELSPEDDQALAQQMASDREAGWAVLLGALMLAGSQRLYAAEQPHALGEHDSSVLISAGVLRPALERAGGGPMAGAANTASVSGEGRGGLMSGQTVSDLFAAAAVDEGGWVWVYGDASTRTNPFPPHEDLDGLSFPTWEDDALLNNDSFPDSEFYFPSDHDGCQCTFARDGSSTVSDQSQESTDGEPPPE